VSLLYPDLPDIIRVHFTWSDGNGKFGSRIFFDGSTSPYLQADLQALSTQISVLWGTNLKGDVGSTIQLVQVDSQDLGARDGAVGTWQGNIPGTAGSNELPSNVSANIRPIIPQHYRGGHPITHHPAATLVQTSGVRNWTGTFATGLATHWQAFITALETYTHGTVTALNQVVPLGYKPGASTADVVMAFPTQYFCPTRFGTMRRRLLTRN